jgi:hypothetical protein
MDLSLMDLGFVQSETGRRLYQKTPGCVTVLLRPAPVSRFCGRFFSDGIPLSSCGEATFTQSGKEVFMKKKFGGIFLIAALTVFLAGPASAGRGNGGGQGDGGGEGWQNPNANRQSEESATRGQERAEQRRSEQGAEHSRQGDMDRDREHMKNDGNDDAKAKTKSQGAADDGRQMKQDREKAESKTQGRKRWWWPFGEE